MVQHQDINFQIQMSNKSVFSYLILLSLLLQYEFFASLIQKIHLLNYSPLDQNLPDNSGRTYSDLCHLIDLTHRILVMHHIICYQYHSKA